MTAALPQYRVIVGVTGASGSAYADLLVRTLLEVGIRTYVVFTDTAKKVIRTEIPESFLGVLATTPTQMRFHEDDLMGAAAEGVGLSKSSLSELRVFLNDDLYAPIASGSEGATHMIVVPSSMGTLARIAHGMSSCLLERAADVMLKERRTLVVVPRETPFNAIHLQNMLALVQAGAVILPAMPGFYQRPQSVEELVWFVVERILDQLRIPECEAKKQIRWNVRRL